MTRLPNGEINWRAVLIDLLMVAAIVAFVAWQRGLW